MPRQVTLRLPSSGGGRHAPCRDCIVVPEAGFGRAAGRLLLPPIAPIDAMNSVPTNGVEVKDIPVTVNRNVDLLVLIDDSPSMADKQANLAANFPRFIDVLSTIPGGFPNVHIGVATSDRRRDPGDERAVRDRPPVSPCKHHPDSVPRALVHVHRWRRQARGRRPADPAASLPRPVPEPARVRADLPARPVRRPPAGRRSAEDRHRRRPMYREQARRRRSENSGTAVRLRGLGGDEPRHTGAERDRAAEMHARGFIGHQPAVLALRDRRGELPEQRSHHAQDRRSGDAGGRRACDRELPYRADPLAQFASTPPRSPTWRLADAAPTP